MTRFAPDTRRRLVPVTIVVVAIVVVAALVAGIWYLASDRGRTEVRASFASSVGLYPGSDVRMLGVKVGAVDSITPEGTSVLVRLHLDGDYAAAADTGAVIYSPSLVSDRYVQLTSVWTSGPKLADGATIPLDRTRTPVELDQIYSATLSLTEALGPNGANKNGALSNALDVGAENLDQNGKDLNNAINGLADLSSTAANSKDQLFATVTNLSQFTQTLQDNDTQIGQVNSRLSDVTSVLAGERQTLAAALQQLAVALQQVKTFIAANQGKLDDDITRILPITQLLVEQKASLEKVLASAPLLVDNFIKAYDPVKDLLVGRANLNELSIWAGSSGNASTASEGANAITAAADALGGGGATPAASGTSDTSGTATTTTGPPLLLPNVGGAS